ncbi:hypothetical protein HU200_057795 [Digitaria exilis]|uniref:At1g61320/AtMIF1 LRR domain-containing protein n=1 Tax=Digitaria exilis TaxID=1010633 RepID=A0A835AE78_9POAL|nr:hypothetical protein HU200_057795 [Digitaria exilis]
MVWCEMLQVVESAAPNLSTINLLGDLVQMSFGTSSQVKNVNVGFSFRPDILNHAITKLPTIMPHLETLTVSSMQEIEHQGAMKHDPVSGDDTKTMRQIPECKHDMLKKVHINGFFSTKSLVDLTCHILEIGTSLESLTLDTIFSMKEDSDIAPNLSTVDFFGEQVQLLLGESSKVKKVKMEFSFEPNFLNYAITKLPSIVPHLETLTVSLSCERINTPMVADKFLHVKHLNVFLRDDDDGASCYPDLRLFVLGFISDDDAI